MSLLTLPPSPTACHAVPLLRRLCLHLCRRCLTPAPARPAKNEAAERRVQAQALAHEMAISRRETARQRREDENEAREFEVRRAQLKSETALRSRLEEQQATARRKERRLLAEVSASPASVSLVFSTQCVPRRLDAPSFKTVSVCTGQREPSAAAEGHAYEPPGLVRVSLERHSVSLFCSERAVANRRKTALPMIKVAVTARF